MSFALVVLCMCNFTMLQAQTVEITGTVIDASDNSQLPGVTVVIQGTNTGTNTNLDGEYSISAEIGNVLVFSYIGYESQNITVEDEGEINVSLSLAVTGLDELVVVGYGTQRAATLTGSITRIDDSRIKRSPAVSVSNSLAGLLPGLVALNRSGEPGGDVSQVLIRGQNTTGNTSPLIVVDGVPDETGAWQRINQNDIEQVSVLKDASASIYGARAANGVILITTKRGGIGKPTFDYSFNQGISQPTRLPEVAHTADWAEYVNQRLVHHQNLPPQFTEEEIQLFRDGTDPNYQHYDWPGMIFKDFATQSMHNLSVRGGSEDIRYSVSGSYSNQNSIVRDGLHGYNGYTLRTNLDANVTDNLTLSLDLNGGVDDKIAPEQGGFGYFTNTMMPPFWPNGLPSSPPSDNGNNAAINLTGVGGYEEELTRRISMKGSFDLIIPQVQGLGVDGYYSYNIQDIRDERWREPWNVYNYNPATDEYSEVDGGVVEQPDLRLRSFTDQNHLINLRVKYEQRFGDHFLNTFLGVEQAQGYSESFMAYRRDFVSPAIRELFAGGADNQATDGSSFETARQNIFGRISYNFQEKYLVDVNLRYDGSYAFPKGNRWGFFPGVSVAWRLSEENFLSGFDGINELKLRASYGQMGNDAIAPYQYLAANRLQSIATHFGEPKSIQPAVIPGVAPNPNITWEVATTQNIGLDGFFWDGLIGFSLEAFQQKRENILTTRDTAVPVYTGLNLPDENIGVVRNRGVELDLSHRSHPSRASDFSYSVSGNIAFARNKVLDVSEPADLLDYQRAEGAVIGAGLYYRAIGIFRTQEEVDSSPIMSGTRVGDLQYEDINGDGVIDARDRVRVNKGNIPEITYGFNTTFGYKNLSLFAHFAGQARAWVYFHQNARIAYSGPKDLIENRYTPGSMDSKYPIIPQDTSPDKGEVSGMNSTFWLQNASFLRLKTLQLGYDMPDNLISNIGLSSMQVYINGSNLFTITDIEWFDPEAAQTSFDGDSGIYYSRGSFYPQQRIFNLGFNITF
jgi:TonB-dependent starch-binding outer membrane protein SusC